MAAALPDSGAPGLVLHSCRVSRPRRAIVEAPARHPRGALFWAPRPRPRSAPAACVGPRPGATPQPSAADVPAARKAGVPAPDVEALLAQMTLDEKIGQMTQADKNARSRTAARSTSSSWGRCCRAPTRSPSRTIPPPGSTMTDRFQSQALSTRLGIPIFYGVDAVHGDGDVKGSVALPAPTSGWAPPATRTSSRRRRA